MNPARKALANTGGVKLRGPKFQQTFSNMGPHVGPTIWQLSIWLGFNCPDSAAGHVPISRMLFVSTRHQPLSAKAKYPVHPGLQVLLYSNRLCAYA